MRIRAEMQPTPSTLQRAVSRRICAMFMYVQRYVASPDCFQTPDARNQQKSALHFPQMQTAQPMILLTQCRRESVADTRLPRLPRQLMVQRAVDLPVRLRRRFRLPESATLVRAMVREAVLRHCQEPESQMVPDVTRLKQHRKLRLLFHLRFKDQG